MSRVVKYILSAVNKNLKLSAHFSLHEFQCRDGSATILVDLQHIANLEKFRSLIGNRSMTVNSAYRTAAYNARCGGVKSSQHLIGKATDITVAGMTPKQVAAAAIKSGLFRGIGIYKTFVHLDDRDKLTNRYRRKYDYWDYSKTSKD